MPTESPPTDILHLKLAWLELSASGTFTVGLVCLIILVWLIMNMMTRK